MITEPPKRAFEKPKSIIPTSITRLFLVSQLLFGIDFGFSAIVNKPYRPWLIGYTRILSLIWIIILFTPCLTRIEELWWWLIFTNYFTYSIILIRAKYSAYNLINDILLRIIKDSSDIAYFGLQITVNAIFFFALKILFVILRCSSQDGVLCFSNPTFIFYWLYLIPWFGMDGVAATRTIIFFHIRLGVKQVKEYLKTTNANLKRFQLLYTDLADCYDKIRPLNDNLLILKLTFGIPRMLMTLWVMLTCIKENKMWFSYFTELLFALHVVTQIALAAIVAELVNSEVDAIKKVLNKRLVECEDDVKSADMNRILKYIESRPLRHLVWRFIPLDMRLLTALVGICTSYFIVIIQFTHLYD